VALGLLKMNRKRELLELEQKLALAGQALSAHEAAELIADDFIEFGVSGKVWRKSDIVTAIASWPAIERDVKNFAVTDLGPSTCLVTYESSSSSKGRGAWSHSLRSSIWRESNGKWQIIFHQGTRTAEEEEPG
jgi:hypothetical protein